jgi:hypothetical protein
MRLDREHSYSGSVVQQSVVVQSTEGVGLDKSQPEPANASQRQRGLACTGSSRRAAPIRPIDNLIRF